MTNYWLTTQIFIVAVELAIPTGIPTKEAKAEARICLSCSAYVKTNAQRNLKSYKPFFAFTY